MKRGSGRRLDCPALQIGLSHIGFLSRLNWVPRDRSTHHSWITTVYLMTVDRFTAVNGGVRPVASEQVCPAPLSASNRGDETAMAMLLCFRRPREPECWTRSNGSFP